MSGGVVEWAWKTPAEGEKAVVTRAAKAATAKVVESCGWTFERALCRWIPKKKAEPKKESSEPSSPTTPSSATSKRVANEKAKKKVTSTKLTDAELEGDHYELLGLEEKSWESTDDEILKAYKKKCLETHPDKQGGDETLFKRVQIAGDVLTNPIKRKAYDSSLPFDDTIPPAKVAEKDFFALFFPVFERNKQWFVGGRHKVPSLGDDSTPIETVDAFYTFWLNFKSWRDFSHEAAEHDLEQAEHREERRWMERENQRANEKMRKEETARINQLVERAYKADPRIRRRDAEREAEKNRARLQKAENEKKRLQDEKDALEQAKKDAEDEKVQRKERQQKEKKLRQAVRKIIKAFEGYDEGQIKKTDSDWLLAKLEMHDLETLLEDMTAAQERETVPGSFYEFVESAEARFKETRKGISTVRKEDALAKPATVVERNADWTPEELLDLQKACTKFPAGTVDRWNKLSDFLLGRKGPKDCLTRVKLLEQEYRMPQQTNESLKNAVKTQLPSAIAKDATLKENASNKRNFADPNAAAAADAPAPAANGNGTPEATGPAERKEEPAAAPAAVEEDIWSAAQQKAIETALRDLKAYKEKDKWDKIAERVEGKTRKQCVARYKFLSAQLKK